MREQKLMSFKNLAAINKLLSSGWEFSHTVGSKSEFALLVKYRNGDHQNLARIPTLAGYGG